MKRGSNTIQAALGEGSAMKWLGRECLLLFHSSKASVLLLPEGQQRRQLKHSPPLEAECLLQSHQLPKASKDDSAGILLH